MKITRWITALALALSLACNSKPATTPSTETNDSSATTSPQTLNLYTWADYIKPELVERFEKENNCKVVIDTFDSNEAMFAKISSGATGYDVIVPSSYMVQVMARQNLLMDLDHSKIPNLSNVDRDYLKIAFDKDMKFSAPYMLSYTGIGYLASKVGEVEPSWNLFADSRFNARCTLLNDMRETIGAGLKFNGFSLNSTDENELAKARDTVIGWKKNIAKFENEQYKNGIASGEFVLVHGYSGDILQVQEENEDIVFVLPKEGYSIACDDLVVPKSAKNPELAFAFINFIHDPDVAAENTEYISYLCPNASSYTKLSAEILANPGIFPSPEVRAVGEVLNDLGDEIVKYNKIWDEIKAAQ
ncbi:MAG: spermidine/putrescine ABC transporter substrate-binding protein [Acidobacteria bacterium]|nr:spermidine/putrescine ABC transporter substrate-binding protein [Acidobacteriota bacterium]MCB9397350.1 spermidine/putrescine ABC transporter substrate-binding protein [Acidobacteriota bacterium]